MGFPPTSSANRHVYPPTIQVKLYQAFIFSIPILFSIILFLLFYLFYLKRKATSLSSPSQVLPTSFNHATLHQHPVCQNGLDQRIKDKLPIVLLDEELRSRDSHCCVCLAEYEMKEELLQIPSCKHVFHIECIHHWLHSNTTCPICRSSVVIPTIKIDTQDQSATEPDTQTQIASLEQQQQQQREVVGIREEQLELAVQESPSSAEEASSMNHYAAAADGCSEISISIEKETGSSSQESIAFHTQIH